MTMSDIFGSYRPLSASTAVSLPTDGVLVVGFTGSPASQRALDTVCATAGPGLRIALVCAIDPIRPPAPATFLHDALKSEAYLLSDRAVIDELLRRGMESVRGTCRARVTGVALEGDPVRVLAGAVARFEAAEVVVGMSGTRPTGQVRHIARALPDDVPLLVTNGERHVRLRRRTRDHVPVRPFVPGYLGRAAGV